MSVWAVALLIVYIVFGPRKVRDFSESRRKDLDEQMAAEWKSVLSVATENWTKIAKMADF